MQNNTVNVNAQCSLSPDEIETLLRAEIEMTGRGMEYGMQKELTASSLDGRLKLP